MPILLAEPCRYPEDLFSGRDAPGESWWLLHTRPRAEKAVARALHSGGVSYFLPTFEKKRKANGRIQISRIPLFNGYLFLRGTARHRLAALETNKLVNCIPIVDGERIRAELEAIHRVMNCDLPYGPERELVPGTPVKILHGPLAGIEGRYRRDGKRLSIVVEVRMLNRGVFVEIEPWMVATGSKA